MNFAENLKALREKNAMTQEQLAEKMEVSRQTVSKWESGASFPEMEKLVQLTELFGCTMDGMLKGNMLQANRDEAKVYDEHGNWVARTGAAATCICILSLAAQMLGEYISPSLLGESGILFLLCALIGALLWIRLGMASSHFRKKHPYVEPFYTEEQKEAFHHKYMSFIITGVGILIAALIVVAAIGTVWQQKDARMELVAEILFFILVAAGVTPIVYIALQASKYNVEGYNADNAWDMSEEGKENGRRIGKACGIILLIAVICCVMIHELTGSSARVAGIPLVIGGILCGVASMILNRRKD
ncbi:MAG: helix-turn-helix transcriptional regulator [Eubacteriales bacterium]|nr:helix-turn-helix transcriptional regulator [Eubacteriales bacterium]